MRISRVLIKNYRSIKELDFSPADLCALIGGNNAGKSNIIKAINVVLGDRWPGANSITDSDVYGYENDTEVVIAIWFDEPQEVRGDVGDPVQVWGIRFTASRYKRASGKHKKGDRKTDFVCIDNQGDVVKVLKRPNPNKNPFPQPASVTAAIREALPSVLIDVDRSASFHLSGSQWSILGRLLRGISKGLKEDQKRYAEFREKFEAAREVLRTDDFVNLEKNIIRQLEKHTGLSDVRVILDEVDPINLYKSFSVLFQDGKSPQPVDAEHMGSGIQSAVVISLLQAYRELRKENAVLLFEEPELFLHPHGRRHLFQLLCELTDEGTQVIYTTHSQDLVDLTRLDCVQLVTAPEDQGTVARPPASNILGKDWKEKLRIAKHFGPPRSEILFANSVILVEGATEIGAIQLLCKLANPVLNLDRLNCSVVSVDGKRSLPIMIRVVNALGKSVLAVYDTDSHLEKKEAVESNEKLNEDIEAALGATGMRYTFDPYLEEALKLPGESKKDKDRQMREFVSAFTSWDEVPKELQALIEEIRTIAEQSYA